MSKKKKTAQEVFDGRVRSMIQQLNVNPDVSNATPNDVLGVYGFDIVRKLLKMTPATRGEVAEFEINGREIIIDMALRAIVLRMYELLQEEKKNAGKIPTTYPIRKLPYVPCAVAGMPASDLHSRWPKHKFI